MGDISSFSFSRSAIQSQPSTPRLSLPSYYGRITLVVSFIFLCIYTFIEDTEMVGNSPSGPSSRDINFAALGIAPNSTKFSRWTTDSNTINRVDVVISWLNASDPAWRSNFDQYGRTFIADRYVLSNEVKLNLISLTSFSQDWLGNIYILSEQRFDLDFLLPEFRNLVKFVRDSDIIPAQYLPMFNSNVVEMYIHKIKGLSDAYLYLNDDMLLLKPFDMSRITNSSKMIIPMDLRPDICESHLFAKSHPLGHYNVYRNTVGLFRNTFGSCIPWVSVNHPPYFQSVRINELTFKLFSEEVDQLSSNRFRNEVVLSKGGDFSFLLLSNFVGVHVGFMTFSNKFRYHQAFDASDLLSSWANNKEGNGATDFITMQDLYRVNDSKFKKVCGVIISKSCNSLKQALPQHTPRLRHEKNNSISSSLSALSSSIGAPTFASSAAQPPSLSPYPHPDDRVRACTQLGMSICSSRAR